MKTELIQDGGRLRIKVQPPGSLEVLRSHRVFHIPLEVEGSQSFAALRSNTGMCRAEGIPQQYQK